MPFIQHANACPGEAVLQLLHKVKPPRNDHSLFFQMNEGNNPLCLQENRASLIMHANPFIVPSEPSVLWFKLKRDLDLLFHRLCCTVYRAFQCQPMEFPTIPQVEKGVLNNKKLKKILC